MLFRSLNPSNGRFFLETTGIDSGFYQQKSKLVEYFGRRSNNNEAYPGLITAEEFRKHWPDWTVGSVTLMDSAERLSSMLKDGAGFRNIDLEQKYWMRNEDGTDDEMYIIVGRADDASDDDADANGGAGDHKGM